MNSYFYQLFRAIQKDKQLWYNNVIIVFFGLGEVLSQSKISKQAEPCSNDRDSKVFKEYGSH